MPTPARNTIVIDNGGHRCRVGFAGEAEPRRTMMNGMAKSKTEHKTFVADQVEKAKDFSALQYRLSLERGVLVNWDTQAEVWARAFGPEVLKIAPAETSLLLSEAPLTPSAIQDTLDEMVFEHFGFHSYCTRPAPTLAALGAQEAEPPAHGATLVVDAGFSATHCVPIYGGHALNFAAKRLNIGGKLLTNHLKQVVSYRSLNVLEETRLMNDVKHRLCYLSLDFDAELALTRFKGKKNTIKREFVLPDFVNTFEGRIRDPNAPAAEAAATATAAAAAAAAAAPAAAPDASKKKATVAAAEEQALTLSNERICVPELLFTPSDLGMEQAGVAECVVQAVDACVPDLREALYSNIVVTGGSTLFPNFEERLRRELRALAPTDYAIGVKAAPQPLLSAWRGGSLFAASEGFAAQTVTREQYREGGHSLCRRKFLGDTEGGVTL